MENIKDLLLKLHYLKLEVHTIYQIILKLDQFQDVDDLALKKVLESHYERYRQLNILQIKEELLKHKISYQTILCEDYPKRLLPIFMPPLVLFYKGDYRLAESETIAVIGTRDYSPYGEEACDYFVKGLVEQHMTIVSGLAKGIDRIAHEKAIVYGGRTIAVLGSGLLAIYPKENKALADKIANDHLLISEYPPYEPPSKTHFPFRNRIVSGLSDGVVVIEAAKKSGTLITCDFALDQGKDIYVVPGNIFAKNSEGTNNLIKQGAKLINTIEDILEYFGN
jgi:DNA processing protein